LEAELDLLAVHHHERLGHLGRKETMIYLRIQKVGGAEKRA
jgi:hypothetical protein